MSARPGGAAGHGDQHGDRPAGRPPAADGPAAEGGALTP